MESVQSSNTMGGDGWWVGKMKEIAFSRNELNDLVRQKKLQGRGKGHTGVCREYAAAVRHS